MEGDQPPTWLEGQAVSFGQSIPFLPLIEQLRLNFQIEEFDGEPEIIAKVERGMRRMGSWRRTSPTFDICCRSIPATAPSRRWTGRAPAKELRGDPRALPARSAPASSDSRLRGSALDRRRY
jgi:hypothetical protein